MSYDPDWFIEKIKQINKKIFEEGKVTKGGLFGTTELVENDFAQKFEAKRADYQSQYIKLFESV